MRLLLAEDDPALARATSMGLMQSGYAVDWVRTGNALLSALLHHEYDCVLLDLGLPELDGTDCLRNIRAQRNFVPVIVITARAGIDERIDVLDLGADDYLVKPFDLNEMSARVRAVVRRGQAARSEIGLTLGPLQLMPLNRTARWHGELVHLGTKEFWILEALIRKRGRALSRQQLEEALYGWEEEIGSNTIEVHVHNLRRKLHPNVVVTVRGVGYQIAEPEVLHAAVAPKASPPIPD